MTCNEHWTTAGLLSCGPPLFFKGGFHLDMEKLYREHTGLVWKWVRRYSGLCKDRADVDAEDLFQAGFLGMCNALETYKPACGAWSNWASYYIRKAIRTELGMETRKGTYAVFVDGEPVRKRYIVQSLDAPAYASDDCDISLSETIADDSIPDADEALLIDSDAQMVREAVAAIKKPDVRSAITERYFNGKTLSAIAADHGVTYQRIRQRCSEALRLLAKDKRIRDIYRERFIDEDTRFIARKGVYAFFSSGSSSVEDQVIRRDVQRRKRQYDRLDALVDEWQRRNINA